MTLFEALSINKEMLHRLHEFVAKPDDCRYIDLYRDYQVMRERWEKVTYIVTVLSETNAESNQAPCLSLVQFQIDEGELVLSAYQRSSDANLGLPADIYHLYLMARQIELPLKSITLFLGNVHIYENNIERTRELLAGNEDVRFDLNV